MKKNAAFILLAICLLALGFSSLLLMGGEPAGAQGTFMSRVSVDSGGVQGNLDSTISSISGDGRYVAFNSRATNLVISDTNNLEDTFLHDRLTGLTSRVSIATDGTEGDWVSNDVPALSDDGRHIAFSNGSSNLVPGDTNGQLDIFVHDRQTAATVRVSVASDGSQGNLGAEDPDISADGRYVAFATSSALIMSDTNGRRDVYVHDRDADNDGLFDEAGQIETIRVSVSSTGAQTTIGTAFSQVAISADGRHVSFDSADGNLVSGDTNNRQDTSVHDRDSDGNGIFDEPGGINTVRISIADDGSEADDTSSDSDISGNGRYVTFWSQASTLVPNDLPTCNIFNCFDIFVRDRDVDNDGIFDELGQTTIWKVSVAPDGSGANNHSYHPAISGDGSTIVFYSLATNLVPNDNGIVDVFRHVMATGITERVSVTHDQMAANNSSFFPSVSTDGQLVSFYSSATNLVPGDSNFRNDVFLYNAAGQPATATPSPTNTPTQTATPSPTPTITATPSPSPTPFIDPPIGWQEQTLAVRGDSGPYLSMVLDSNDHPHISYESADQFRGELHYLRWDGVVWQAATVDTGLDVGEHSAIALFNNDQPIIVYRDAEQAILKYARWNGASWEVGIADNQPGVGYYASIAISPASQIVHVLHMDILQGELLHSTWGGAGWSTELLMAGQGTGSSSSLAFDSNGILHATYYDGPQSALYYATLGSSGDWSTQLIDDSGDVGQFNSLSFDSFDRPHISYYDSDNDTLKYAHYDSLFWQTQTINNNGAGGQFSAIDLDSNDNLFISYHDGQQLYLAEQVGSFFDITILDNSGSVGQYSNLSLDSNEDAHIAYYDSYYGDLKYVTWGPRWEIREADLDTGAGQSALGFSGPNPGISFYNSAPASDELDLVSWQNDAWHNETLLNVPNSGVPHDLVYDSAEQAHVAAANGLVLSYRHWDGTSWQAEVIETLVGAEFGDIVVLQLDQFDTPYVIYSVDDGAAHRLHLAWWDGSSWQQRINNVSPPLGVVYDWDATVGSLGNVYISYYDATNGELRLATWADGGWIDALVTDGAGTDTGRYNAIAADLRRLGPDLVDTIAIAYYDVANQAIAYSYRETNWTHRTAVPASGLINSLDLVLGNDSGHKPYISYIGTTDNSVRMAYSDDGFFNWHEDIVVENGVVAPADVTIEFDYAPRLAYRDETGRLAYAFPASRHHIGSAPAHYSNLVGAILGFGGDDCINWSRRVSSPEGEAVSDGEVLAGFGNLFGQTPAGRVYGNLYLTHVDEMARIVYSDPVLVWDAYRTMQNFMPGLRAWVNDEGSQVMVTQEMAEQALDIWQRIASEASPELENIINGELAASNNLQDFVGGSFDDWAIGIGVLPPGESIYLPVVSGGATRGPANDNGAGNSAGHVEHTAAILPTQIVFKTKSREQFP